VHATYSTCSVYTAVTYAHYVDSTYVLVTTSPAYSVSQFLHESVQQLTTTLLHYYRCQHKSSALIKDVNTKQVQ